MTEVKRYRKKPLVIEAVYWDGTPEEAAQIVRWILDSGSKAHYETTNMELGRIVITTLEGEMKAWAGDYVLKGIKGEFYPHSGSFFDHVYDEVSDDED